MIESIISQSYVAQTYARDYVKTTAALAKKKQDNEEPQAYDNLIAQKLPITPGIGVKIDYVV